MVLSVNNKKKDKMFLPPELLENILLRLPPCHLSKVKVVCKDWKFLIESFSFVNNYDNHAQETNQNNNQLVSIISSTETYTIEFDKLVSRCLDFHVCRNRYSLTSESPKLIGFCNGMRCRNICLVRSRPIITQVRPRNSLPHKFSSNAFKGVKLIGSCNGLLCYTNEDHRFLLYNVATQTQYAAFLNPPPSNGGATTNYEGALYGFGYDRSRYDYKVVRIVWDWGPNKLQVEVYSMQKKSWKGHDTCIEGPLFGCNGSCDSVFVNGFLHWLVLPCCNPSSQGNILRFDVCSEEMSLLPWHPNMTPLVARTMCLDVLDGCLCAWFPRGDPMIIETWVMKIYGVKESWIKLISIQFDALLSSQLSIKPIALSKDGSKLYLAKFKNDINGNTRLYCYDIITNQKVWEIEMPNFKNQRSCLLQTSVQSKLTLPLEDLK